MFSFIKSSIGRFLRRKEMEKRGFLSARRRVTRNPRFLYFLERSATMKILMVLLVIAASVAVIMIPTPQSVKPRLVEKQIASKSIFADFDFSYEDTEKTAEVKETARKAVPLFYRIRTEISD